MKNITFKVWLSVFFGGIWQFIRNIFSWKNKTPFWRVIWAVITICILAITSMIGYVFYEEFYGREHRYAENRERSCLGDDFYFYNKGKGKCYIADKKTGRKIHTGLDWIARPVDGDSLVVFAKDGKRGFLSRRSGNIVIPARYDAAWCFNDGVAGVCLGDSVFFIDHNDRPIHNRRFARIAGRNYSYHGEFFAFTENGKQGLVDKSGRTAVPAIYDGIVAMANRMWNVRLDGKTGTVNADGVLVVPCEYKEVFVYPEGGIVVMEEDNSKKKMDYSGIVTNEFVYDFTSTLEYYSDDLDEEGNRIRKPANMHAYSGNGHYGLMDKNGRPVTPPVYGSISAYSADLYECQIDSCGEFVMLDANGNKVGQVRG